ncbi:MAG: glycosyltransferase [Opitutae bacterium]|nr:glycosyltransferase [Opitutae bacterium]
MSADGTQRPAPRTAVIIRTDTLGDLILFSATLRRLRTAWPQTRIVVVTRHAYRELAERLAPGVEWLFTRIDCFGQGPTDVGEALAQLKASIVALQPELVISASPRRNWLETLLAAAVPSARRVALGTAEEDPFFGPQLRLQFGVTSATAFGEFVAATGAEQDWQRNLSLADHLLGSAAERVPPSLALDAATLTTADATLRQLGLEPGRYVVCAAAGFANVRLKTWPAERFGRTLAWLRAEHQLPALLVGQESERAHLETVRTAAGDAAPALWLGREGELPLLAGLIARSTLFLGNDTGAMHLAAALDRPVVAIFGGGTWPRFTPAARQSIALVHPISCFGCGWDCPWGDAPCIAAVAESAVQQALTDALRRSSEAFQEIRRLRTLSDDVDACMGRAAAHARTAAAAHLARQHQLEETAFLAGKKDAEIASLKATTDGMDAEMEALKRVADERQRAADGKDAEIAALKQVADERQRTADGKDAEIAALKKVTDERQRTADAKDREITALKAAADTKDREIVALKKVTDERQRLADAKDCEIIALKKVADERQHTADGKDAEIAALAAACAERLALIERLDRDTKTLLAMVAQRDASLTALQGELAAVRQSAEATETFYRRLAPDAAQWAQQLADASAREATLRAELAARTAELQTTQSTLREREISLQNHANGLGVLELNKHYHRLLREKENVLQTLHRACQERDALIRKLAAESTPTTGHFYKLGLAASAWWQSHVVEPTRGWLYRNLLDGYWMQLGALRQYEPRPVKWDARLRLTRRAGAAAPKIGLVTPSYNQAVFLERTMRSVLEQNYPRLLYVVQDGGSKDASPALIQRYADRLHFGESAPDKGQADAVRKGFLRLNEALGPDDAMAWLNSDDLLAPGALAFVGRYFAAHPEVDAIYGHRIIIDADDREIGRWVLPKHNPETLRWIDFIPQETLFWRKRAWDQAGGIDPSFHFALDWDLLLRLQEAGMRIVRVPYFLGAFRVHDEQKTSAQIHTRGQDEMQRVRTRVHGPTLDYPRLDAETRRAQFRGAVSARLLATGLRC